MYKIKIYTDRRNKEPFTEWLNSLEKVDRARIRTRLTRIITGNFGEYKHIDGKIYEIKFKNRSGYRIYYAFDDDTIVLLLNGGNKGSQEKDIEKAKLYWKDFIEQKIGTKNERL